MHRFDWAVQSGVEFHLGYGDWIRLLRASGFEVLVLIEIHAPDDLAIGSLSVSCGPQATTR
jgi:hypothetical protein